MGILRQAKRLLRTGVFPASRQRQSSYYEDPQDYWNSRHRTNKDSLVGVGCIGLGESANEMDYDLKWRHLTAMLDSLHLQPGAEVLDAGCGIGYFTNRLAGREIRVHGVDFSAEAIDQARESTPPNNPVTWHVAPLAGFEPDTRFDAVLCIDVLFHVTNDDAWASSVINLARLVDEGGALLIQEELRDKPSEIDSTSSTHVRRRTLEDYRSLLADFSLIDQDSYLLSAQATKKDLLCFRRTLQATSSGRE